MHSSLSSQECRRRVLLADIHPVVPGSGMNVHALSGRDVEGAHVLGFYVVAVGRQPKTNYKRGRGVWPEKLSTIWIKGVEIVRLDVKAHNQARSNLGDNRSSIDV